MRKLLKNCLLIFVIIASVCYWPFTFAENKPVLNIQHWQTSNGVNVYFVPAPQIPILDIRVVFAAGSLYDHNHDGEASLTNAMIGEGTEKLSASEITQAFDAVGAEFSTNTDRDMAEISLRTLTEKKYFEPALRTFSDVILHPNFPQKQFQRIQSQTLAKIKSQLESPAEIAENKFYQFVYRQFPYAHSPFGSLQTVSKITRDQVNAFYKKYYVAKNAKIILVGAINRAEAKAIANRLVGKLPAGEPVKKFSKAPKLISAVDKNIYFPSKQTTIFIGQVGISRENQYYFPLIVGNHILGGGGDLTSILSQQIREMRGLAYYVYSQFVMLRYRGPYLITLQTQAQQTKEALSIVHQSLTHFVKKGPTAKQLQLAKQYLIGSFPLSFDSNRKIADIVTNLAFYNRPLNFLDTYRDRIKQVSVADIKSAFAKEINLSRLAIITVGPNQNKRNLTNG